MKLWTGSNLFNRGNHLIPSQGEAIPSLEILGQVGREAGFGCSEPYRMTVHNIRAFLQAKTLGLALRENPNPPNLTKYIPTKHGEKRP